MKGVIAITAILLIVSGSFVAACPMHLFTPADQASILLQPTKDEITAQKVALIAGDITVQQYTSFLAFKWIDLKTKEHLLIAVRDSDRPWENKMKAVLGMFQWTVRSAGVSPKAQLVDSIAK